MRLYSTGRALQSTVCKVRLNTEETTDNITLLSNSTPKISVVLVVGRVHLRAQKVLDALAGQTAVRELIGIDSALVDIAPLSIESRLKQRMRVF